MHCNINAAYFHKKIVLTNNKYYLTFHNFFENVFQKKCRNQIIAPNEKWKYDKCFKKLNIFKPNKIIENI